MLGTRIATLRQGRGLSQAELAKKLHISPSAVGMYEQGRREPSVDTLIALAKEFDVTLDYLLSGQPDTLQDISAFHEMLRQYWRTPQSWDKGMPREEVLMRLLCVLME